MKQIMTERVSRRKEEENHVEKEKSGGNDLSKLVSSVKKKAQMHPVVNPVVKKQKFI